MPCNPVTLCHNLCNSLNGQLSINNYQRTALHCQLHCANTQMPALQVKGSTVAISYTKCSRGRVLSKPCRASHFHISSILSRTLATFYGQEDTRINFTLRPSSDPYRILLKDIQRGPTIAACVLLLIKFAVNLRTNYTMITQR